LALVMAMPRGALAQLSSTDEERLQILSDPEALKKKLEKDKSRAPFEFFRSQIAPFDVLPLIKPHQWATLTLEVRANYADYEGQLQSFPVALPGMPQEMVYARDARLVKEQRARLGMQFMLPVVPKEREIILELVQPGAIRYDELWQAAVRVLPPHQMLVVILSKDATNQFAAWNRLSSFVPSTSEREDTPSVELQRYYRLILPLEADKPFLSPHPLTWAPISHVIWDALPPDTLSVSHQQAMLDWLHWGGQIIIVGGAGPTFSIFRDSFLAPYLPADPTGDNKQLNEADLRPLSQTYPPPVLGGGPADQEAQPVPRTAAEAYLMYGRPYRAPVPIRPPANRPLFLAGLQPRPGAATIPLGEASPHLLAVESRVGRGRITMLTINPNDPTLTAWPGLDTLIRRVVLRRPEEETRPTGGSDGMPYQPPMRQSLEGPDLSWYRIASRDDGAEAEALRRRATQEARVAMPPVRGFSPPQSQMAGTGGSPSGDVEEAVLKLAGVAEWRDTATIPRLCRDVLEKASGISVPSSQFVLKVILAYLLAVVPLNYLVCRVLLARREWAWLVVPLIALGFAVGVERVAAYDLGYDSACDEVDLLEIHGAYPRAHLSRFASLYSTGRGRYTISFPNDPTALALPLDIGRSISGEDVTTSVWQSYPVPALRGFSVQPRSLSMFRAEQMIGLAGPIALESGETGSVLVNGSDLELRDAVLVDFSDGNQRREIRLGTIAPGASIELKGVEGRGEPAVTADGYDGPDPRAILEELRRSWERRPENLGELRLVAWVPRPQAGQSFDPGLDRHRGMTAVLVHLRHGNPPSPDIARYNLLAVPVSERSAMPTEEAFQRIFGGDGQGRVRSPARSRMPTKSRVP
jgi:hypothetical protein